MSADPLRERATPAEDRLQQYVRDTQKRLAKFHLDAKSGISAEVSGLVEELIEELHTSVEELRVSQEELREQNHALAESQLALAAERQRYHELFEFAPDPYLVTDQHGVIRDANRAAARLMGIEQRYLTGKPLLLYLEQEDRRDFASLLTAVSEWVRVEEWQLRLRPRGAPPIPVALSAVSGEHGERVEEIRWLIRDTTERTRAEERVQQLIREQAAREQAEAAARRSRVLAEASRILSSSVDYRHTLRAMVRFLVPELADAVIVYMLDGEGQLERLAAAHSGPRENASLQQLLAVRTPDRDSTISPVARVIRTGKAELIPEVGPELLGVRGESPESLDVLRLIDPRSLMVVPLVSGGAAFGAISLSCSTPGRRYTSDDLGMAEDLASRVTLAVDNARLYAEAERAARARQELLHVVSHDMRNSLNAALLHVELLLSSTPAEERRVRGRSQIETIQRSLNQMHRLVQDLLETEKLEEGQLVLQRERQEIPPLLEEVLEMLQPVAEEEHLHLESHFPEQLPAVLADRGRLLQVFFNLVGNAVKFTPPGGRIMLRAELLGSEVCFSVTDTGPGIAAADLPHVFDPYWQGDQGAYGGRGLGLAIARGIVEGHEGRIWVESRQGVGSTFCFTIPLADAVQ
ncbi:MAG: PAS domain S-box protein [Gemmatimonadetes bacterium]|nr:PAS domain S-box protein [Gemmatimonadota bacterium]